MQDYIPLVHELCRLLRYHKRLPRPALVFQSSVFRPAEDPTRNSMSCGHDVFFRLIQVDNITLLLTLTRACTQVRARGTRS